MTNPSCDGDAMQASSLLQTTALQKQADGPLTREEKEAERARIAAEIKKKRAEKAAEKEAKKKDPFATLSADFCRPEGGTHLRVRKNIFDMDIAQLRKFKAAFQSLHYKGLYKKYAVEHTKHYHDDPENGYYNDHGGAYGFLAFHRGQIQDLETELMKEAKDCSIGFPFWDWSMDVGTFKDSEIWSDEYMGDGKGCVVSGLPRYWKYYVEGVDKPCVERNVRKSNALYDSRRITLEVMDTNDFEDFVKGIEGVHNVVHGAIGGNMARKVGAASPSDPMFYLHHAFIDSVYFRWQKINEDTSASLLRDALVPLIGEYTAERDCVYLPVHRSFPEDISATCVHYQATELVHPAGSALLQAYNADSNCVTLQKQMARDECSREELEKIVCTESPKCILDEAEEYEDSAKFVVEEPIEHKEEDILHKLNTKTQCKFFTSEFTSAEESHCYKCDVLCTGKKK